VKLKYDIHYIDELILEQKANEGIILISPFVMVEMLLVLSHCRLGNRRQSLQSLTDLHNLLLFDEGRYVPTGLRDLSWQILGICQQVAGDLHGALHSYHESLRLLQLHKIQAATEKRIAIVVGQLERNTQS
jgi:hypothetical protein